MTRLKLTSSILCWFRAIMVICLVVSGVTVIWAKTPPPLSTIPPLFTITTPDSKHLGLDRQLQAINVVELEHFQSNGMVPVNTYATWSRWLVLKVDEKSYNSVPRYYFLDQKTHNLVGPWKPGAKVFMEGFAPDGRFVAFDCESFLSSRALTQQVFHFDPATGKTSEYKRPESDHWQERISLDKSTLAAAKGGDGKPLEIDIINLKDNSHRCTLTFSKRQHISGKRSKRDLYDFFWNLSPNGSLLALSNVWTQEQENDSFEVEIWDTHNSKLVDLIKTNNPVKSVRFSPNGEDLLVDNSLQPAVRLSRRYQLSTKTFLDGFNPWKGIHWTGRERRGFSTSLAGMDGKHVVFIRHPTTDSSQFFLEWEIRVTDIQGNVLRDWKSLPNSIAPRVVDRLDVRIVPGSNGLVVMNPNNSRLTWYNWKTDQFRTLAKTHRKHNRVDFFGVQPNRVSVVYRKADLDIQLKVWSALPQ